MAIDGDTGAFGVYTEGGRTWEVNKLLSRARNAIDNKRLIRTRRRE